MKKRNRKKSSRLIGHQQSWKWPRQPSYPDGRWKKKNKCPTKSPKHYALAIRPSEEQHPRRPQIGNTNSRENQIARPKPGPLNSLITNSELKQAMKELKSNSMGPDLIHNKMLANLTEENKKHILHLFSSMLQSHFVPSEWETATIIPIRKAEKPADKPESYRPISLTSYLGKMMEKIINQRWFKRRGVAWWFKKTHTPTAMWL